MTGRRLVAWVLIALGITYALFIGGEPAGIQLTQVRLVSVLVIAIALGAWGLAAIRDESWRPRSVFLPALAACVGSMALSTVTSRSPRVSVEYLAYAVLWAALYLLLVQLLSRPALRTRILALASLVGYLIALLFLAAVLLVWARFWSDLGRITTPPLRPDFETLVFGNPAVVVVMVTLLGAIAVGLIADSRGRSNAVAFASIALFGTTVLVTGTRGGWLAVGVGALGLGIAALYARGVRGFASSVIDGVRRRGPAQVLGVGVAVAVAVIALAPAIVRRLSFSEGNRFTFYQIAAQLFGEEPLTGVGPGIWAISRLPYTPSSSADEYVPHAHNLMLQGLAEMGLVGLAAGVVAVLSVLWLIRDGLRDSDPWRRRWAMVATFTSGYFFSHQLVDLFANAPATFLAFAIPIALLDASRSRAPRPLPDRALGLRSRLGAIGLALPTAAALVVAIAIEIPALIHADAVAKANAGDWASARAPADEAAAIDALPIYRLTAGLAAAHGGDYVAAADDFRVIAEAGDLPEAWLDLADAYAHLDRNDLALAALDRALRLGRQQPVVAVASAQLALQLGDRQTAVAAIADALSLAPSLVDDPWWTLDPERAAALAEADQAVSSTGAAMAWQLAMYARRFDEARAAAATLAPPDASLANLVIAAWDGGQDAYATLVDQCLGDPYGPALKWCIAVATERGAVADEQRFLSIAQAVVLLRRGPYRLVENPSAQAIAGNDAIFYGIDAYRRFTPWDMLSPGLVHLADK